jgi:hypothetical protein
MDFVVAATAYVQAAASDLSSIGSAISSANSAIMAPTTEILAAGADSVSMELAALFGLHGQMYQALSAQAQMFHSQFVELMNGGATQYALAEAANSSPLQIAENLAVFSPVKDLTGRALVGDGANATVAGKAGQDGGWFYGNGGNGAAGTPGTGVAGGAGGNAGFFGGNGGNGAVGGSGTNGTPSANPALRNGTDGGAGGRGGNGGLLVGNGGNGAAGGLGGSGLDKYLATAAGIPLNGFSGGDGGAGGRKGTRLNESHQAG